MMIEKQQIPNVPTPKGWYYFTPSGLREPGIISSIIIPSLRDLKMKEAQRSLSLKLMAIEGFRDVRLFVPYPFGATIDPTKDTPDWTLFEA